MENKIEFIIAIALYRNDTWQLWDYTLEDIRVKAYWRYELYINSDCYYIDEFINKELPNIEMF